MAPTLRNREVLADKRPGGQNASADFDKPHSKKEVSTAERSTEVYNYAIGR